MQEADDAGLKRVLSRRDMLDMEYDQYGKLRFVGEPFELQPVSYTPKQFKAFSKRLGVAKSLTNRDKVKAARKQKHRRK